MVRAVRAGGFLRFIRQCRLNAISNLETHTRQRAAPTSDPLLLFGKPEYRPASDLATP